MVIGLMGVGYVGLLLGYHHHPVTSRYLREIENDERHGK